MNGPQPLSQCQGLGAELAKIALAAGHAILDVYASAIAVTQKDDRSPVTEADARAEVIIAQALRAAFPDVPVIAEEAVSAGNVPDHGGTLFLVDPLDGTREFIARRGEFTVNIALVENFAPVAGCVYAPAWREGSGWICFADPQTGAYEADVAAPESADAVLPGRESWRQLAVRTPPQAGLTAVASRSHINPETSAFLEKLGVADTANAGSALKFCLLARGDADVYPRLAPTMEWDTAAGDAVLRAAGGCVTKLDGQPMAYGATPGSYTNPPFVAWGRAKPPEMA